MDAQQKARLPAPIRPRPDRRAGRDVRVAHAFFLRKAPWPWRRALSAGLSLFAVIALGALFHRPADGLVAAIGAFTGIYATDLPPSRLAVKLAAVGAGLSASFGLGMWASFNPLAATAAVAVVGAVATYLAAALSMAPPGPFFFVMAAAIASGQARGGHALAGAALVLAGAALVLAGAAVAWTLSMLLAVAWRPARSGHASRLHRMTPRRVARPLRRQLHVRHPAVVAALRMAVGLVLSSAAAQALHSPRGYWTAVGCAATLAGMTVMGTLHRAIQRALGSVVGVALAGAILYAHPTSMELAILLFALQTAAELLIPKNYGLAVIFITPLAILIAEAGQTGLSAPAILQARLWDTLLGCAIALALRLLWRAPRGA
ncbi:FUSC family protein [Alicyclobacillus sendaiensis]|uniref:FUSC family protein n=1 Tax=Alicyclobacillus sendaiensis PA2 TaxID=3029425 RepID=A0ABT6Y073_ALISE|nr:FUSC family protein [Alicyclobacillus sendaiensis]MDI9260727.1 FUSC family protein [Alicyclobacillus sendaiensis PA2]